MQEFLSLSWPFGEIQLSLLQGSSVRSPLGHGGQPHGEPCPGSQAVGHFRILKPGSHILQQVGFSDAEMEFGAQDVYRG